MRPGELVAAWVDAFNRADVEALTAFYHPDAVNHQVAEEPVEGAAAIREMFARGFAAARMVCIVEHIFEDGGSWNGATRRASAAAASSTSPTAASPSSAATGTS